MIDCTWGSTSRGRVRLGYGWESWDTAVSQPGLPVIGHSRRAGHFINKDRTGGVKGQESRSQKFSVSEGGVPGVCLSQTQLGSQMSFAAGAPCSRRTTTNQPKNAALDQRVRDTARKADLVRQPWTLAASSAWGDPRRIPDLPCRRLQG